MGGFLWNLPVRLHADALLSDRTQAVCGPAPGRAVLLSFPDREAALGWIEDPEFAEVHALRRAAGDISTILIG